MTEQPMERATRLARRFRPHPNPRVGAVVVDPSGVVIGEGAHERPGLPHAEIVALEAAGDSAAQSTMYVTLEPCSHTGRTGPCTDAIINAGVARVVVGRTDPDQRVSGAGVEHLRRAGVEVVVGEHEEAVADLDPGYFHHRMTGRPRFTLKAALTLDGQVAALDGTSQWITGPAARADGHRLRAESDVVVVGAGTVLADDPRLDVRLPDFHGSQPRPVLITGTRPVPGTARVLERDPIVVTTGTTPQPGETLEVTAGDDGWPELESVASALGAAGVIDALVEGGPTLAGGFWRAGLIDRGVWYLAGRVGGGSGRSVFSGLFATLEQARGIEIIDVRRLGTDLRVEFVMED